MQVEWLMPAGAIVYGKVLTEPTVLYPCWIEIDGAQYEPAIFDNWTVVELAAIGCMRIVIDVLPDHYIAGDYVDVQEVDDKGPYVHRTWPNAVKDEDAAFLAAMAAIDAEYEAKLDIVRNGFVAISLADGPTMDTKLNELRADYQRIMAARNAATDALFE